MSQPTFDVVTATGILNTAMRHNMFPQGGIPESDIEKISAAKRVVESAQQAMQIALVVGKEKVPKYAAIEAVLFEAQVTVGSGPEHQPQAQVEPKPAPLFGAQLAPPDPPAAAPALAPEPAPAVVSTAGAQAVKVTFGEQVKGSQPALDPAPPPVAASIEHDAEKARLEAEAAPMPKGSVWADPNAGEWTIARDLGPQVEVLSQGGEPTTVPRGFLKKMVKAAPPVPATFITVSVQPDQNKLYYRHPRCFSNGQDMVWWEPLDGLALPVVGDVLKCAECGQAMPIQSVEANGYVPAPPAPEPEEQPSPPSQPQASSASPQPSSSASPSESASTEQAQVVDDHEGDERYREILDRVEADWAPSGMPAPRDMDIEPIPMPDDLTADDTLNRRLHSQFNALAARARYLGGLERAKARDLGRARKLHMTRAMREARAELGKDATVTEVKELAEADEQVTIWRTREERHADKADAYKTYFEIYAENVTTLSRDLTWAGTEQSGS